MNEWPERSYDGSRDRYGRGSSAPPEGARSMPHVRRPTGVPPQSRGGYDDGGYGQGYDSGYNTGQVYGGGRGRGGGGGHDGGYGDAGHTRPPRRRPRFKTIAVSVLALALVWVTGTYFWADSKLEPRRQADLGKVIDRPESGEGTNYLIVGSDSREGMTAQQKKDLHTGSAAGKRTDSMMILHKDSTGSTLISLPRDSWMTIPDFVGSESGKKYASPGATRLNAAYAQDGPELLVRTVEYNTGLRIDHYAEIGFAGFANIVDAVGGVEMDIPRDIKDKDSGADFKAGRQTLDGAQALAFVRNRKEAGSDLERTKNQQKFLSTLASQVATPSTVLNPFKLYPTMGAGLDTLIVDKDMGLFDLASMFWGMKGVTSGEGTSLNLPTAGPGPAGSLAVDKEKLKQLVSELNAGEKVTVTDE